MRSRSATRSARSLPSTAPAWWRWTWSRVPDIEYSALQMLLDGERRFTADGVTVWLAAANPSVLACIRASPLAELGRERLLFNARAVITKYQDQVAAKDKPGKEQ